MESPINVFVELLDEGVETWWPTWAVPLPNGLFKLLEPIGYDPENEYWDFVPGSEVRLEMSKDYMGQTGLLARHPNPEAIRIFVDSTEKFAPQIRETWGIPVGNGLYEVQATPHYTPAQEWKFPPGSIVRLRPLESLVPEPTQSLIAIEP